jgi:hypothetical protein
VAVEEWRFVHDTESEPQTDAGTQAQVGEPGELAPTRHPICMHLRTKKMYYAANAVEAEEELIMSSAHQTFWCMHTMTDTGPDDGYVEHQRCRPGRRCYEPVGG